MSSELVAVVRRHARAGSSALPTRPPGLLLLAWAALVLNVLTWSAAPALVPLPGKVGQLITQSALPLALLLVLAANPRRLVRPSLFLSLLAALAVVSLMVSLHSEFLFGAVFRATRLCGFVAALWLTTRWWGRSEMFLLRCHRLCLWGVVGTVLLGAAVSPGLAFSFQGRLSGVLWPIPPTQVAHYAAVLLGTSAVLWFCRLVPGRRAAVAVAVCAAVLAATHTRTALLACAVGLGVAGASLFVGHVRVRRTYALGAVGAVLVVTTFASQLSSWILRGQTPQEAGELTGRTKVWSAVFDHPRPVLEDLFGSGLSDQSFNGLPIDSNWVATYLDQGWFGVVVHATLLMVLLLMAATHVRGAGRAVALFLITYCLVASFTETGLFGASAYLLDLSVAASLLVHQPGREPR